MLEGGRGIFEIMIFVVLVMLSGKRPMVVGLTRGCQQVGFAIKIIREFEYLDSTSLYFVSHPSLHTVVFVFLLGGLLVIYSEYCCCRFSMI